MRILKLILPIVLRVQESWLLEKGEEGEMTGMADIKRVSRTIYKGRKRNCEEK